MTPDFIGDRNHFVLLHRYLYTYSTHCCRHDVLFCAVELTLTLLQIVHNLSRATDVDASLGRLEERSRHVQINEESICDSCHARLGTKLFAMYPDDTIVCYKVGNIDISFICVFGRSKLMAATICTTISAR